MDDDSDTQEDEYSDSDYEVDDKKEFKETLEHPAQFIKLSNEAATKKLQRDLVNAKAKAINYGSIRHYYPPAKQYYVPYNEDINNNNNADYYRESRKYNSNNNNEYYQESRNYNSNNNDDEYYQEFDTYNNNNYNDEYYQKSRQYNNNNNNNYNDEYYKESRQFNSNNKNNSNNNNNSSMRNKKAVKRTFFKLSTKTCSKLDSFTNGLFRKFRQNTKGSIWTTKATIYNI